MSISKTSRQESMVNLEGQETSKKRPFLSILHKEWKIRRIPPINKSRKDAKFER